MEKSRRVSKTVGERLRELVQPEAAHGGCSTIRLSLPAHPCNPNSRAHWAVKARAVKALRTEAYLVAATTRNQFSHPLISATFYHAAKRVRDRDNAIASLKGAIDGLVDGAVFANDALVQWGAIEFCIDKDDPHVVLLIKEMP